MTTAKQEIKERDITGLKYFEQLVPLLERLHDDGCKRDRAGNRHLHYDQYCMLLLLFLFNPIVTSLRGVQQASELKKVQKKLGCQQASLGSLSEATSVFDADRLKAIIAELGVTSAKDMGKVMAELKTRYAGQLDMSKVGPIVKSKLAA